MHPFVPAWLVLGVVLVLQVLMLPGIIAPCFSLGLAFALLAFFDVLLALAFLECAISLTCFCFVLHFHAFFFHHGWKT